MKTKVVFSSAILLLFCCATVSAQWPHYTYANNTGWEVELGARIMDRPGRAGQQQLNLVTMVPTNQVVFTASDATDLDASMGAEFRFLRTECYDRQWEVRGYFNSWENVEYRSGNLRAPVFTPTFAGLPAQIRPSRFDYSYESDLFNIELMCKKSIAAGLTCMIGPRFVNLDEESVLDTDFITPLDNTFLLNIRSRTRTRNRMPGLGFGLECRRPLARELFFVGSIRGAILANFAKTDTITTINNVANVTVFDDSRTNAAGIGELSGRFHYDIAPGTVSGYLGYEAMWLDGVTLSPGQLLANVGPGPVEMTFNTAFIHGLVFGCMIRW
ncbi:MAG: hypothetical protein ACR2NP_06285 [Pirellulaceae bacterium]